MNPDQIEALVRHLRDAVSFSNHAGLRIDEAQPGRAAVHVEVEALHLNGAGLLHGGVIATLMDSAMAVALLALDLRPVTTQIDVHFLGAVTGGRIAARAEVIHRTRRTATVEARVHDAEGALVATGTGSFHVSEGVAAPARPQPEPAADDRDPP